jgi:hypothetical protein
MSFVIDYVEYHVRYDTFVAVSGTVSPPPNWDLTIPSSVTNSGTVYTVVTVGSASFYASLNLTSIVIPDSVTSIEQSGFNGCNNLRSITLSNSLLSIGLYAFIGVSLKNIIFPSSLTSIGDAAFIYVESLKNIAFEGNISSIGTGNFGTQNDTVYYKLNAYNDNIISTIVPSLFTYAVAYTDINSINQVDAPQNVTGIAGTNMVIITWSAVTNSGTIEKYQISYYNITTPSSITTVNVAGNISKSRISGLTNNVTYVFSVKAFNISSSVASSTVQLTPSVSSNTLDAPQNVIGTSGTNRVRIRWSAVTTSETIYKYQISYYNITSPSSITTLDVDENVTQTIITGLTNSQTYEFSVKAFDIFSSSLASSTVQVTPSEFDISTFTFEYIQYGVNNSGFPELIIQTSVNAPSKWDLTIPSSVTNSGTVYTVVTVGSASFYASLNLTSIAIPDSVTSIEQSAFNGCNNLRSITLSNSLLSIGLYAFVGVSLKNIIFPSSLTSIGDAAFIYIESLKNIAFEGNIPSIGTGNFGTQNDTVYYKSNTYNDNRISTIVPSLFTYAVTYTDINSINQVDAPQNVTGIAGTNMVRISWSAVTNSGTIDKYQISYYNITTPSSITTVNVIGNVTKSRIAGLTNNVTYVFSVKAFNISSSVASSTVQLTPAVSSNTPDAPQNVTVSAGTNRVRISWSAVTTSETIYKYQISYYNITTPSSITTLDVDENVTKTIITGLTTNVTYDFSVKAFDIFSSSVASSTIQVTPAEFDRPTFTFEYVRYGSINSELPELIVETSVNPPSNWQLTIPSTFTRSGIVYTVVALAEGAFANLTNLISIVLPDTITNLGPAIFYFSTSLTSIVLGANTVSIQRQFAQLCSSLRNINLPDTIELIDRNAFEGTGLTSIVLPNNPNLQIREKAFAGTPITNVIFPNYSVLLNGRWIFLGCTFLTSINFGNAIENIPDFTFSDCTSLKNLVIPNSVTYIGAAVFVNCTTLTSVVLSNNLPYLSPELFNACISLTNIIIPTSVTLIEGSVFNNCFDLTNIIIPSSIKRIGDGSFQNCTSLTNFVIPDSVTSIGTAVLNGCSDLTNITIGIGITTLPRYFFNSPFIRSFVIPENINTISRECFGGGYIENLYIPDSVTSIGLFIFMWSPVQLTSIRLPSNLTKIPDSFFQYSGGFSDNLANNIQSIIPASVTEIGIGAFYGTNIKRIDIPYGVIKLGNNTFDQCGQLTHITFPNTLKIIDENCFTYARFTDVIIPSSVTTIGSGAFGGNFSLAKITINAQITEIPANMLSECGSLTKVNIPNTVNIIRQYAFYGTSKLINIFIPSSVTSIESQSFRFSGVKKAVFLGSTIPTIGSNNFTESNDTAFVQPNSSELSNLTPYFDNISTISLDPPQNVTGTGDNSSATISWTATVPLFGEITKYQISYYDITIPSNITTVDVSGNVTQRTIIGLTNNVTYVFSVKLFIDDTNLSSDASSTVQVTPKEVSIDAPQNVTGITGINRATISWSAVTIASPYTITKYQISYYDITNSSIINTVDVSGNVTQNTITSLTNNVTYEFSVKAFSNLIFSPESSTVQVTPFSLNAPQNVSGTSGVNKATISWSAVTAPVEITKYQISYYNITTPSTIITVDVSGNIAQTTITGLTNDTTYEFSVKSFINDASSVASSSVQVTPFSLNAPQNVTGTAGASNAIISWSAVTVSSPNTITKYQISYYDITTPLIISTIDVSGNITQSKISGLTANIIYEFSVKVIINNLFLSDDSSKVQVTPFSLNAPQNVTGTIGVSSATISWSAVTAPIEITKYQISYYDISNSSIINTLDVSANLTQLTISSLINDITYEFSVKAFINEDSSLASSSVQVTPLAINTPQNFTGVASVNRAIINWSAVTVRPPYTITKYQISYYDISNSSIINTVDVSENVTQTTISELTANVRYEFSIKAFVNNLSSVDSSKIQVTPFSLNPPQNVNGIENINNGATISWSAVILPSPNVITKYQLSYYNITTQSNITTLDVSGNVTQSIFTNLTNNETYEFSVKAFMNNFSSLDSSTNQVTPFVVGIPQNVTAVPGLNSATISWSTVIIPSPYIITKYQVSYYNTTTPEVISIGETNTTSLTINNIQVNRIYIFSVKAFFYSNSSESSDIVSIELSLNNILNEGLKNINNEPPPPTFLYNLITSSSFTEEELTTAGITIVPIIVSKEEQQQQVQTLITDFTNSGLEITYITSNIG